LGLFSSTYLLCYSVTKNAPSDEEDVVKVTRSAVGGKFDVLYFSFLIIFIIV